MYRGWLVAAAAGGALSISAAFSPHTPGVDVRPLSAGAARPACALLAPGMRTACGARRDVVALAGHFGRCTRVRMADSDLPAVPLDDDGGTMPRRAPRLRKEVPTHVQDVLREASTRADPLEDPMRLADFKGLDDGHKADSKTINNELYVKGLPFDFDHEGVRQLFARAGHKPKSVRILTDRKDKTRSLGFGFVRFKTEQDALAALQAMNGKTITSGEGVEKKETMLSISKASAKGKARQLSSKPKKAEFQHQLNIRKMQLSFDAKKNKRVTSLDQMPRAYRVMADKNAKTKRELTEELAAASALPPDLNNNQAQAALDRFLQEGGEIEELDADDFAREIAEARKRGTDSDDVLYGLEGEGIDEDDGDWMLVTDDGEDDDAAFGLIEEGVDLDVARREEEEEERRNWEEYQRMQLKSKDNLRPASETKASGALRSGQKKIKVWTRNDGNDEGRA